MGTEKPGVRELRTLTPEETRELAEALCLPCTLGEVPESQLLTISSDSFEQKVPVKYAALHKTARLMARRFASQGIAVTFHLDGAVAKIHKIEVPQHGMRKELFPDEPDESFQLLIPAGGLGTRMQPLTFKIPKPLLPVRGIPLMSRIKELFSVDRVTMTSVLVSLDDTRPKDYGKLFSQWWKAHTDARMFGQKTPTSYTEDMLELLFRQDERYAIVVSGDKFLDFDQEKIGAFLDQLLLELEDCSFLLVGRRSEASRRRVSVTEAGILQSVGRVGERGMDEGSEGFGSAFFVFDTEKLPVILGEEIRKSRSLNDALKVLVAHGIRGRIVELPEGFSWRNINTLEAYEAETALYAQSTRLDTLLDPQEILTAHTHDVKACCVFPEEQELVGGRSGSEIIRVTGPGNRQLVRKSKYGALPVDEVGGSERQAFLLDEFLFAGGNFIEPVHPCSLCEKKVCSLGPFVDGQMLDELICTNIYKAHAVRLQIMDIMESKGYFKQERNLPGGTMWEQWLANREDCLNVLREYVENDDPRQWLGDINLPRVTVEAIGILIDPKTFVPHGFFPRDLNPANIIVSHNGTVRVIDQTMLFGDPAIIPLKLVIGWRRLSNASASSTLIESIKAFEEQRQEVDALDAEMLKRCMSYYPKYPEYEQRFHAALLIRHVRGLISARKKYAGDSLLQEVEQVIGGYISESLSHLTGDGKADERTS